LNEKIYIIEEKAVKLPHILPNLPLLKIALDRFKKQESLLIQYLNDSIQELKCRHLDGCNYLSKAYAATAEELSKEGLLEAAAEKYILSDVYAVMRLRIYSLLFKSYQESEEIFNVSWEDQLSEIRRERNKLHGVTALPISGQGTSFSESIIQDSLQIPTTMDPLSGFLHPSSQTTESSPKLDLPLFSESLSIPDNRKRQFEDSLYNIGKRMKLSTEEESLQLLEFSRSQSSPLPVKPTSTLKRVKSMEDLVSSCLY
jgi:hypothetical protein